VQFFLPDRAPSAPHRVDGAGLASASWQALTKTEQQVAEVVANGLTNREAGRRVYMSPHTVDAHLRHIFRKLGINTRVELARIVGQRQRDVTSSEPGSHGHEAVSAANCATPPGANLPFRCRPSTGQPDESGG
jgi:DNA-binding CsgD family transcriptional regulator